MDSALIAFKSSEPLNKAASTETEDSVQFLLIPTKGTHPLVRVGGGWEKTPDTQLLCQHPTKPRALCGGPARHLLLPSLCREGARPSLQRHQSKGLRIAARPRRLELIRTLTFPRLSAKWVLRRVCARIQWVNTGCQPPRQIHRPFWFFSPKTPAGDSPPPL